MDAIHKINQISINKSKTEFCICCNNGIKVFNLENFEEKYSSDNLEFKLGSITLSIFLNKDNTVIFVGSKYNKNYPANKVVFLIWKKELRFFLKLLKKK